VEFYSCSVVPSNRCLTYIQLLNVDEASEYLSIGKTKLHSWIKRKKIPVIKLDTSTRFDVLELDAFVEELKSARDKKNVRAVDM